MSNAMNFRSALNGFHREDVVNYISYINSKRNSEISALENNQERLNEQLAQAQKNLSDGETRLRELQTRLEEQTARSEELQTQLEAQTARNEELQKQLAAQGENVDAANDMELARLPSRCAALEEELLRAQAKDRSGMLNRNTEQELEAYRRAERTERVARERAELIYRQASNAIDGASDKVDTAFTMISDLSDQVSAQLAQLHSAISGSKHALAEAASTLCTIRPEDTIR